MRWSGIRDSLRAQQESEKRQAEAAQAEEKRAAEARVKKQEEEKARQERLQKLEQSRSIYDRDIFELSRKIRKLVADLKSLKDQDDGDVRKERERNSWWAILTSPIYGQVKETEERAEALRRAEEVARRAKERQKEWSGLRRTKSTCLHRGWWPKVEGRQLCAKCHGVQNRFALQCPGCSMVACAGCQKGLRGARWKSGGGGGGVAGRRYGFAANVDYDYDYDDNAFFDID